MTDNNKKLQVELIMDGGWIIEEGSNFDPSLHSRAMGDIGENHMRTGLFFPATVLEALVEKTTLECDESETHFKQFYDIVKDEVLSVSESGHIEIDLRFTSTNEARYNSSCDDVTIDSVMNAISSARELNLSGSIHQAYLASEPAQVRELIEALSEEPELSMESDYNTAFICDGHLLSEGEKSLKYAVVAGGTLYKLRGEKAVLVDMSRDQDSEDDLDI